MSKKINSTPKQDGFRVPAEYNKHSACWLLWPENKLVWRNGGINASKVFLEVIEKIAQYEKINLCVSPQEYLNVQNLVNKLDLNVRILEMSNNDSWMRDVGPTFTLKEDKKEVRGIRWKFNAYGDGYNYSFDKDQLVSTKVLNIESLNNYKADLVFEGGSFSVDGKGTVITTKECLLNPNRNPDKSQREIEDYLKNYLNVNKVIWLEKGVYADETSGHVDNFCRFVKDGEVILHWTDDKNDFQYERSHKAYKILKNEKNEAGNHLKINKIHQPKPLYMTPQELAGYHFGGRAHLKDFQYRLAASYINSYISDKIVILPIFGDREFDNEAINAYKKIYPKKNIIPIENSREILLGGGNVHCITCDQPAVDK